MTLKIIPNADLEREISAGAHLGQWKSLGDDPAFEIRFSPLRKKLVVIHVAATSEPIDPKLYINRGYGFREKDTVSLPEGNRFVITADIGSVGSICALRADPASFPTSFKFAARAFASEKAAERYIATLLRSEGQTKRIDLGRLPQYWLKLPRLRLGRRAPSLTIQYAEASYRLASELETAPTPATAGTWLSVVVPVYNAPPRYLDDLVKSFETQGETGAELILSDDGSTSPETQQWYQSQQSKDNVRLVLSERNGGIAAATNAGLSHAKGQWIAFLDHDDVIAPHAFKLIRHTLELNPDANFLYTDELVVDDTLRPTGVMLKPAYDSVLLTGVNYINHFSIYRHSRLREIGYLRTGYDGSQDYDLLLRYMEGVPEESILHLPYPAYWWRRNGKTYSRQFMDAATANARKALTERFARQRQTVSVDGALTETLHRVVFDAPHEWPKISVIIPSKDNFDLISRILGDLFEKTDYPNFEVLVVDNGSADQAVLDLYEHYRKTQPRFSAVINRETFNFSRSVNRGLNAATGEHCLILNNDVEVIEPGWLKEMVSCLAYDRTGIVGAKLLFSNDKMQHAGVVIGFGGLAGHWYLNKPKEFGGPMNRLHVRNTMTCVTGAVMLISGDCLRNIGLFDEENFAVAYNDVDYCLRAHKAGYRIIWTPFACLYHHESLSRGSDKSGERKKRFEQEKQNLRRLHATQGFIDRALNPAYGRDKSDPKIVVPTRLHIPSMS
ncbi:MULTISPECIES: glycosyltransferase family 2 protein [unclassified Rhizobium]|uniref:glycosyltransferase family 2 protein n=1 Tax=unclassified Rhizobium TaxID=2613769 RepID=UPI00160EB082|nr:MULTISPECIES: glycosyltransferase family 2 protein [unclassified Rhizobium]MBB3382566.1 GT2 family glycosyltransferase [Rhizobium sp. BK098]MBB3614267.1 GT2 family glycosyltransferase [Rhizobium sp. BK609]MBB3680347.1 GT2 family glycosyltransferase [Rhizobium sp. BK612]